MIDSSLVIKNVLCFEPFDRFLQYLPLEKLTALRITPVHLINPIICPLARLQAHLQIVMADQVKGGSIFTIFKNQAFLWLLNWVKTVKPCSNRTAAQVSTFIPRTPQYNAGFSSAAVWKAICPWAHGGLSHLPASAPVACLSFILCSSLQQKPRVAASRGFPRWLHVTYCIAGQKPDFIPPVSPAPSTLPRTL